MAVLQLLECNLRAFAQRERRTRNAANRRDPTSGFQPSQEGREFKFTTEDPDSAVRMKATSSSRMDDKTLPFYSVATTSATKSTSTWTRRAHLIKPVSRWECLELLPHCCTNNGTNPATCLLKLLKVWTCTSVATWNDDTYSTNGQNRPL